MTMPSGFSRSRTTPLVAQHVETGKIVDRRLHGPVKPFSKRHADSDIRLLAKVGESPGQISGPGLRVMAESSVRGTRFIQRLPFPVVTAPRYRPGMACPR